MKIPEKIISDRIQREVQLYEENELNYESASIQLQNAYLEFAEDPTLEKPYLSALQQQAKYYDRLEVLHSVINNLFDELESQKQLKNKKFTQLTQLAIEDLPPPTPIIYQKKPTNYKQFMQRFLKEWTEHKENFQTSFFRPLNPPNKKTSITYKPLPQKQPLEPTISIKAMAAYKQNLLSSIKSKTEFLENPYKDQRVITEQQKLEKFEIKRDQILKQRKKDAQDFAKELAIREIEFQDKVQKEKDFIKNKLKDMAISTKNERVISKVTGNTLEGAVADAYIPDHLKKHVSERAKNVIPPHFGLGLGSTTKSVNCDSLIQLKQQVVNIENQADDELRDLLGVQNEKLNFSRPQSQGKRPSSKQQKKPSKDAKKMQVIEEIPDEGDSSDDVQPVAQAFSKKLTVREKQIPVIKQTKLVPLSPSINKLTTTLQKSLLPQKLAKDSTFISQPDTIYFYNFKQQVEQAFVFTITNNSATIQTFKINEIEEQYRNMFKLEYSPSGMLAPGQGTRIKIKFTYNDPNIFDIKDVFTELVIRHQSGSLLIPIYCYKESFKIQIFNNYNESFKVYNSYINDASLNYKLNEDLVESQQYEVQSTCLVDGNTQIGYYFINTGFQPISCSYQLKNAGIIELIELLPDEVINTIYEQISYYQNNIQTYADQIKLQFTQYNLEQQALADKKKLKTDKNTIIVEENFQDITDNNIQEFISKRQIEKYGQIPEPPNEQVLLYKEMFNFAKGSFLQLCKPKILFLDGNKFNEQEYKLSCKQDFTEKKTFEIKEAVQKELYDKKTIQLNTIDPKKKRPITPPQGTFNYMDENIFNEQLMIQIQERISLIDNEFKNNFSVVELLLHFQQLNDLEFQFIIPPRSLIFLSQIHSPKSPEFKKLLLDQQLNLLDVNNKVLRTYKLQTICKTCSSPVQLEEEEIDFKTCFWGEQYNQTFQIGLFDQAMTQSVVNITNQDPASQSRKVSIVIPENLKQFITVDQNDMILNVKNMQFVPKLSLKIASKKQLNSIKNLKNEFWSDIQISDDQFATTRQSLNLDSQITDRYTQITKISDIIETEKAAIQRNEIEKLELQQQIDDMIKLRQEQENSKKPVKPVKQLVTQEELEQQIVIIDTQLSNSLQNIQYQQEQLAEIQLKISQEDFSGSYICFQFKVKVIAFNQPECLYLHVKVEFTNKNISCLLPHEIQSGHQINLSYSSNIGVYHKFPLQVQNHSALPQHIMISNKQNTSTNIGFSSFSEPNGGIQLLMPGETKEFYISYKLDIEKKFVMQVLIEAEYGQEVTFQVIGSSQKNIVQTKLLDDNIYEIALNDIFYTDIELSSLSNDHIQYTIAPSFINEIKKINNFIQFLPTTGILEKEQRIKLQIDLNPLNVAYLLKYLSENINSDLQYINRYLTQSKSDYIEFNAPILIDQKAVCSVITYRFIISQPMVHISEDTIISNQLPVVAEVQEKVLQKEIKRAPSAKSKKNTVPEPPPPIETPKIEPVQSVCSRYVLDFGQQPVGQAKKKQVSIEIDQPLTEFFVKENFIQSFDAELELLSFIDSKLVKTSKMLIFQYLPIKSGKTEEVICLAIFTDKSMKRKINDIIITLKGEGVCVSMDLLIKDSFVPKCLKNNNSQHFIKLLNLNEQTTFTITLKCLISFAFSAKITQIGHNMFIDSLIYGQHIYFENQSDKQIEIILTGKKWTENCVEKVEFLVQAGDFMKIIEILFVISPEKDLQVANCPQLRFISGNIQEEKV
ncbi:hypothetical protein SS50377_23692 [Spironucleus salmonicida]|uniref:Uncharacterized protein n=1 Tax=Spironucleus salmonicida TaxID=348837 RepID=V6M5R3_9EUKA|nr:hypothetical protein SS50377_23692 [Spironucleus salmonicida]|eukprot:EST48674.1 hypothetical protein SS50377_11287 [Spironucleus salmonicida]